MRFLGRLVALRICYLFMCLLQRLLSGSCLLLLVALSTVPVVAETDWERYYAMLQKRPGSDVLFERFYKAWIVESGRDALAAHLIEAAERPEAGSGILRFWQHFICAGGMNRRRWKMDSRCVGSLVRRRLASRLSWRRV